MADASVSKTDTARCVGSSPTPGTINSQAPRRGAFRFPPPTQTPRTRPPHRELFVPASPRGFSPLRAAPGASRPCVSSRTSHPLLFATKKCKLSLKSPFVECGEAQGYFPISPPFWKKFQLGNRLRPPSGAAGRRSGGKGQVVVRRGELMRFGMALALLQYEPARSNHGRKGAASPPHSPP